MLYVNNMFLQNGEIKSPRAHFSPHTLPTHTSITHAENTHADPPRAEYAERQEDESHK